MSNADSEDTAALIADIGPRLRALRTSSDLTLQEVSDQTGISISVLSRLESTQRRPTLELLLPLARLYRVTLDSLVDAPPTGDPRIHLVPKQIRRGGQVVPLTEQPGPIQVFKHVIAPRTPVLSRHSGHAWIYVLAGELRLILGRDEHLLRPGEVAEFDAQQPHWFGPADNHPVEVLHMFGPHGERPKVRVIPS